MRGSGYHSRQAPEDVRVSAQRAARILARWPWGLTRRDLQAFLYPDVTVDFHRGSWTRNALNEARERGWVEKYGSKFRLTEKGKRLAELSEPFMGGEAS